MTAFLPKQLILMRHAQKTGRPDDTGLSPLGHDRADTLASAWPFGPDLPDVIIACRSTPKSTRPVDTVKPLAARLGLPIDERWGTPDYAGLAATLTTDQAYSDRRVLICWRHDTLPQLAASFGLAAPTWPDTLYDVFWLLDAPGGVLRLRIEDQPSPADASSPATRQAGERKGIE